MVTYARRSSVPRIAGTTPRLCSKCKQWFAAPGQRKRCDAHTRADLTPRPILIDQFHEDVRVAAIVVDLPDIYPRTWRNVLEAMSA
jgi:hypothetical protein